MMQLIRMRNPLLLANGLVSQKTLSHLTDECLVSRLRALTFLAVLKIRIPSLFVGFYFFFTVLLATKKAERIHDD